MIQLYKGCKIKKKWTIINIKLIRLVFEVIIKLVEHLINFNLKCIKYIKYSVVLE